MDAMDVHAVVHLRRVWNRGADWVDRTDTALHAVHVTAWRRTRRRMSLHVLPLHMLPLYVLPLHMLS
jgi:hypothetical protein